VAISFFLPPFLGMFQCLQHNRLFKSVFGDAMPAAAPLEDAGLYELLKKQNAETSNAVIEKFKADETFLAFSKSEADGIIKR
jgi:hypothetical protein